MLKVDVKATLGQFKLEAAFALANTGVVALYGPSGSGKTTIVNMIAGLTRPDRGAIAIRGRTVFDAAQRIDLPPEKRRLGYVFQDARLFPHLSVLSNLTYGMRLVPKDQQTISLDEVIALLGIGDLKRRRVRHLSGGEKQRVAIGRALLTSPELLLLDEPLASLDTARKSEVLPFIQRLSRTLKIPIVYVSHSLDEILNLADTLIWIDSGQVQKVGRVEEIVNQPGFSTQKETNESGSVLVTVVDRHAPDEGLTYLRLNGKHLKVPIYPADPGTALRVHINSRDVALALTPPQDTSIQNIFPATVRDVVTHNNVQYHIRLDMGAPITARVTRKAKHELNLAVGANVHVMIKSVAVSREAARLVGQPSEIRSLDN